jgi:putative transposase
MPRKPRTYMAVMPCHVIQRGNNHDACFYADQDYLFYLDCLRDACGRYHVAVHAFVLMINHVHLLMTPENEQGISRVMQSGEGDTCNISIWNIAAAEPCWRVAIRLA